MQVHWNCNVAVMIYKILKGMENTSTSTCTQVDVSLKPVFLQAGIPLAFAAAGFILARITTRKAPNLDSSKAANQINCTNEGGSHDLGRYGSSYVSCLDSDDSDAETNQENFDEQPQNPGHIHELEEEVLLLRDQVKNLHAKELEIKIEYFHYRDLKRQESVAMELENMLLLEIARAQLIEKDISSAEVEKQRFQMAVNYQKIFVLLQLSRSRNRLLQRRIKKLLKRTIEQRHLITEQKKHIAAKEAENSETCRELEAKTEIIRKLEEKIQHHEATLLQLEEEKNDLLSQIELANDKASLKIEVEKAKTEDNIREVVSKLEKLESERAMETEELIYLRWCNACLRHELMRKNQEGLQDPNQGHKSQLMEMKFGEFSDLGSDDELGSHSNLENGHSCLHLSIPNSHAHPHAHSSRRKKFIEKFKRWMESGNDKEKHEHKMIGRHSVPHSPDRGHITHARRKSCSSN